MLTSSDLVVAPKKLSEFAANPERSQIDPGETDPIAERCYFSLCFVVVVVVEIEQHAPSAVGPPAKTSARRGSQADFERILGPVAARTSRDGRLTAPHSKIPPDEAQSFACGLRRWGPRGVPPAPLKGGRRDASVPGSPRKSRKDRPVILRVGRGRLASPARSAPRRTRSIGR